MALENKEGIIEKLSQIKEGSIIGIELTSKSWIGDFRVGEYLGRTEDKIKMKCLYFGISSFFSVSLKRQYNIDDIKNLKLFKE